jgi:hypothetical protein
LQTREEGLRWRLLMQAVAASSVSHQRLSSTESLSKPVIADEAEFQLRLSWVLTPDILYKKATAGRSPQWLRDQQSTGKKNTCRQSLKKLYIDL